MKLSGTAVTLGDNIDTDAILPGKYLTLTDPRDLGEHALEGLDPNFPEKAEGGVIIVSGENFGCGSSREHAPLALKAAGVRCVIAKSFARIYYRNSVNIGLPAVESSKARELIENGDLIEVNLTKGVINDLSKGFKLEAKPTPKFIQVILEEGGLIPHLKKRLKMGGLRSRM